LARAARLVQSCHTSQRWPIRRAVCVVADQQAKSCTAPLLVGCTSVAGRRDCIATPWQCCSLLHLMGSYCTPCKDQTLAAEKAGGRNAIEVGARPAVGRPANPSPRRESDVERSRKSHTGPLHEGQHRADLQVKEGGFALKNFMATNNGKLEEFFEVKTDKLGEGGFGAVRQGKDKRTGAQCAVKSIGKNKGMDLKALKEEIDIMRCCDHPNIIRFMEAFEDRVCIFLVMELCSGGELFDRICKAGSLSEAVASHCAWQMLLAVNYLHQNRITHRDLKPENWLLSNTADIASSPLKLIDFGISKRFDPGQALRTRAGTPNYVAPEVLAGKYDEKADNWSLGVILFVMLSGSHPFSGKKVDQVLSQVKAAKISLEGRQWQRVSQEAKGLVRALLQKSITSRPSAKAALQHVWFEKNDQGTEYVAASNLEVQGLQAFGRMNQLKRAVLTVIATQLSSDMLEDLNAIFMAMDQNSDGTLSIRELKQGLEQAAVDLPMDLNELLAQVDTDGSGVVDYTEFLAATMEKKVYHQENTVWCAFKKFDLDNSGAIDKTELNKVLGNDDVVKAMHLEGKQTKLQELFDQIDINGDGLIDFEEFFRMMKTAEGGSRPRATGGGRSDIGIACQDEEILDHEAGLMDRPESKFKTSMLF